MQTDDTPAPTILFDDGRLIAVDKPSGLLSVPGRGPDKQDCLYHRVKRSHPSALVVHRLDMGTSGLMLFALDPDMQRALGALFEQRGIYKAYVAHVRGVPTAMCGEIDLPLSADWPRRPRQRVDIVNGKPALTRYRLLETAADGDSSRLQLEPKTGRSHQLRVHLAALGHPILGDELYADPATKKLATRLMLHAEHLRFEHPDGSGTVELISPAP